MTIPGSGQSPYFSGCFSSILNCFKGDDEEEIDPKEKEKITEKKNAHYNSGFLDGDGKEKKKRND